MAKLTRNLYVPMLDLQFGQGTGTQTFTPIDLSTIFSLAFNPQEETYGYIKDANDTTAIESYAPSLPQEIALDDTNPIYEAMFDFCMGMPTGSSAKCPVLIAYAETVAGGVTKGYLWEDATISPNELNTVDGKLTFTLQLNGDAKTGTVAISGGTATFTPVP